MSPLFAVRDRLRSRGLSTSLQLAAELSLPLGVVEAALAHFERRGVVRPASPATDPGCGTGNCGSCNLCSPAGPKVAWFRWCGAPPEQGAGPAGPVPPASGSGAHGVSRPALRDRPR